MDDGLEGDLEGRCVGVVGIRLGLIDGENDGEEGRLVGMLLGANDWLGFVDGLQEGRPVGLRVGEAVDGRTVGFLVGVVGREDGA